jgi:surface antigen
MRLTAIGGGVLLSAAILYVQVPKVSAEATTALPIVNISEASDKLAVLDMVDGQTAKTEALAPPQPIVYVVVEGDTLSSIAKQHQTTWKRLYDKNTNVENPDIIAAGTQITVPLADEQLTERELPVEPEPTPAPQSAASKKPAAVLRKSTTTTARGSVTGNTYTPGYCTWYVKNRRPDLPNNLGNAYTWVSNAAAQGIPTGATPAVGAVGQRGNHVVYVESVNADGSVNISEMNHQGLYVVTYRTLPGNYFQYIY